MHEELKERSRLVWGSGNYGPTSRQLEPASARLVESLGIGTEHRVLDVAAGHGNCAIAAARRGARVIATDFSPPMIAVGRARTQDAGLPITWHEADAAALPFDDEAFDRVTSVFGAIFAPEQETVAAEMVRVVRPGSLVGMTAWTPEGLTAQLLEVGREFGPPAPPAAPDPFRWGRTAEVEAMFGALGCRVEIQRRSITFRYASWDEWREDTEAHGMAVVARSTMTPETYDEMFRRRQAITAEHVHREADGVAFDSEYLEIIVRRP